MTRKAWGRVSLIVVALAMISSSRLAVSVSAETLPPLVPRSASMTVLPLEQAASRAVVTRDPSTVVKCKGEFWVFYTGRGVPSYHSKNLVKWEPGPAVFQPRRSGSHMLCRRTAK